jgi:hypothetical protein
MDPHGPHRPNSAPSESLRAGVTTTLITFHEAAHGVLLTSATSSGRSSSTAPAPTAWPGSSASTNSPPGPPASPNFPPPPLVTPSSSRSTDLGAFRAQTDELGGSFRVRDFIGSRGHSCLPPRCRTRPTPALPSTCGIADVVALARRLGPSSTSTRARTSPSADVPPTAQPPCPRPGYLLHGIPALGAPTTWTIWGT